MSDTLDVTGGSSNRRYRLTGPDRRVGEPDPLELATFAALQGPNAVDMLGYSLSARLRGENRASQYYNMLRQVNQAQAQLDARQMAGEAENNRLRAATALADSRNPWMAYVLSPTRRLIEPDMAETVRPWGEIGTAGMIAEVNERNATANQRNVEAGVMPGAGTTYSLFGAPQGVRRQGTPLDLRVAGTRAAGAATTSRLDPQWTRIMDNVMAQAEAQRQQLERAFLQDRGIMDMNGRIIQPQALTPQVRDEVRQQVERSLRPTIEGRFALIDRMRGVPPGTTMRFIDEQAPRDRPVTGVSAAPVQTDSDGDAAAQTGVPRAITPTAPRAVDGRPVVPGNANVMTEERARAIWRRRPSNAVRQMYDQSSNAVIFLDSAGNQVGRVPL